MSLTITEAGSLLATYHKGFGAGAFATPTRKELSAAPHSVVTWGNAGCGAAAVVKFLSRDGYRTDFTGRRVMMPRGSAVVTHFGRDSAAPVPNLTRFDYVVTATEDATLSAALSRQGFGVAGVSVTAAAQLLTTWGRVHHHTYAPHDLATVTAVPDWGLSKAALASMRREAEGVAAWADDFPYYSDGSWSAVSLRGYWPDDPTRGVKPSEMPRSWKAEHRADLGRSCEWTTLAARTPVTRAWVESLGVPTERVRLLRMTRGALARHSDITDRAAGLGDSQIARFHFPLVTHPAVVLTAWDASGTRLERHLDAGRCWYLDARKPHAVTNPVDVARIHLVVDVVSGADVRARLDRAVRAAA